MENITEEKEVSPLVNEVAEAVVRKLNPPCAVGVQGPACTDEDYKSQCAIWLGEVLSRNNYWGNANPYCNKYKEKLFAVIREGLIEVL